MASSLTLLAAMIAAWLGLAPPADSDLSAMGMNSQTAGLAREDEANRGSRSGFRDGDADAGLDSAVKPDAGDELVLPERGSGKTRTAFGGTAEFGSGPVITYRVEVERELPFEPAEVAAVVDATLQDPRSWAANGQATFQRVDDDSADMRIVLATPATTDKLCYPLDTAGKVSCRNGAVVALNADRWAFGTKAYGDDIDRYRQYLVNPEVGHSVGHNHVGCSAPGDPAPVMMQQTKTVGECQANPWPLDSEL